MKIKTNSLLFPIFLSGFLTACGGGGGSDPAADENVDNMPSMPSNVIGGVIPSESQTPDPATQTPAEPFVPLEVTRNLADTPDNNALYINSNTSARLSGPVIGLNEMDTVEFPRAIEFNNLSDTSLVSIEGAFVFREPIFGTFFSPDAGVIFVIRNNSAEVQCGTVFGITVRLADGSSFEHEGEVMEYSARALGSTSLNDSDSGLLYVHRCIGPGDMVYARFDTGALIPTGAPLEEVTGIDFSQARWSGSTGTTLVDSLFEPVSYSINEDDEIEVQVVNRASTPIGALALYIFALDSEGFPTGHDFEFDDDNQIIDVGETFTITSDSGLLKGSTSTLRVIITAGERVL